MAWLAPVSVGLDISLTRVAICRLWWRELAGEPVVTQVEWSYHPWGSVPEPYFLYYRARTIAQHGLLGIDGGNVVVGIDYTFRSAYWAGRRKHAVELAFLIGNVVALLNERFYRVMLIAPNDIRTELNLSPRAPKDRVWKAFLDEVLATADARAYFENSIPPHLHDVRDAAVLAWYANNFRGSRFVTDEELWYMMERPS